MSINPLPIACSLTTAELQERRKTVLHRVRLKVVEVRELDEGYAYSFASEAGRLAELAELVDLERQCCPFMSFSIKVEQNNGPIWLELTGPEGTKAFLEAVFA